MNRSNALNKIYWLLPLACVLIVLLLSHTEPVQRFELLLLDSRFQARGAVSPESSPVQIVALDDQSFSALKRTWPFERSLYADLVDNLNRAGARLIVLDIEFFESDSYNAEHDSLLAEAIAKAGNVILASKMAYTSHPDLAADYVSIKQPVEQLAEAAAGIGLVNEVIDNDGTVRRGLYYLEYKDQKIPTLLGEILRLSGREEAVNQQRNNFRINYAGPSGTFPAISFSSVLDDSSFQPSPESDSDYMERFYSEYSEAEFHLPNPFRNKIVLIGATAPDLHDLKQTPFSSDDNKRMAGIEVLANAVTTCWSGKEVTKAPLGIIAIISLLLAYSLFIIIGRFNPGRAFLLTLMSLLGLVVTAYFLFMKSSIWLEMTTPGLTIILAHTLAGIGYNIRERREKQQFRSLFSHYVPKRIIAELEKAPTSVKLGGERREVTILFADIEEFTAISESMPPEEMVPLLNQYMTEMTRVIQQEGGIIDKYEGDAIMAEFGVPGHLENHAEHACRAALRMQSRLSELRQIWRESGYPELKTRIGINTGQVIVGNMGSAALFDYTVLGSEVNLCARLEKANKLYKTNILISGSTLAAISDTFVTRVIGDIDLRGRTEAVRIHELIAEDATSLPADDFEFITLYHEAWSCLEQRNYSRAIQLFERVNELDPSDLATRINLERSRRLALTTASAEVHSAHNR